MKKKLFLFAALIMVSASGCVPQMYYWGDYSKTLYDFRKNPTEETLLKHKNTLEKIVEESRKRNLMVPPGVYAELGYIYLRHNKNKEAIEYFRQEEQLYPESKLLMQRLVKAAELREKEAAKDTKEAGSETEGAL